MANTELIQRATRAERAADMAAHRGDLRAACEHILIAKLRVARWLAQEEEDAFGEPRPAVLYAKHRQKAIADKAAALHAALGEEEPDVD